jgi:hypothetical protein
MKVIGQDDNGEPIWQLTAEEFAAIKAQREQAKSAPPCQVPAPESDPGAAGQSSHESEAGAQNPQAMELGSTIWEMRKRGLSVYEIHRRLGIPMEAVKEILEQFERCFYPDVGQMIHHYAVLDDRRIEDLIMKWLPIATGPPAEIERIGRNGKPYTELDTETPVKAAAIVLQAIKGRVQLLMACRSESVNGKDGHGQTNILLWLSQVMPGVQKIVNQVEGAPVSRGKQNLVLECAAETEDFKNGSAPRGSR